VPSSPCFCSFRPAALLPTPSLPPKQPAQKRPSHESSRHRCAASLLQQGSQRTGACTGSNVQGVQRAGATEPAAVAELEVEDTAVSSPGRSKGSGGSHCLGSSRPQANRRCPKPPVAHGGVQKRQQSASTRSLGKSVALLMAAVDANASAATPAVAGHRPPSAVTVASPASPAAAALVPAAAAPVPAAAAPVPSQPLHADAGCSSPTVCDGTPSATPTSGGDAHSGKTTAASPAVRTTEAAKAARAEALLALRGAAGWRCARRCTV